MKKYFIRTVFMLCFFLPSTLMAQQQDITGVWNGELELTDTAGQLVHLPYEIAVSEEKGKLSGYSRIIFHVNGKDEAGMQGINIKWKGKELVIEDEGFVEHDFTINPSRRVKKTMILTLEVTDKEMILEGTWSTNRTRIYIPAKGTAILKRKVDFKTSALFKRLDTLKMAEKLSFTQLQKITTPAVAVAPPPVEKKVIIPPPPPPPPAPEPEPDLIIPAIEKSTTIVLMPVVKKSQQPVAAIVPPTKQKKMQMDIVTKSTIKPPPPPPVVIAKPEPVVAKAAPPKPEKKTPPVVAPKPAPVVAKAPAPVAEKKPAEVVAKPAPAPPPPPVAIVAPSITKGAADLDKRITKSDQSVYFESDSLTLTLYDNGEVDGDIVTVVMNGNIIFSKVLLTEKANTKTIYTHDIAGDSVSLVMYAESLGDIPPNTGLMVIMDGEKRYEMRFSADLKTNAAIILRRRKKE